ncbi:hypothetical protein Dret_0639 [Desulfohalobium retbaense DSM 5692]|jgi:hypothetical protein|uniref:Uncharacterized protein n=1 Tax=Desulfohalobium retbaense (strain ATCC 49708 / DSM 5692 / JCM 16813 / HR100) TaxID=485915 RepID=C8WZ17_DESRD|nr:hypothetical protein Dret_0639 [Desulfohalobium retbaense DSM 5692]
MREVRNLQNGYMADPKVAPLDRSKGGSITPIMTWLH